MSTSSAGRSRASMPPCGPKPIATGLPWPKGSRDTGRYVHSVLGMDDGAFRASVFAEQKQLDAFSSQSPADRRKLVLALLGVTPLDVARDKARADAREDHRTAQPPPWHAP